MGAGQGSCHYEQFIFADHQPITQVIDAVRSFLLDQPVGTHGWQALAWCVGILVVYIPLSVSLYRRVAAR